MTTAVCRRNSQRHIHRATKFGEIITADHTILNEEGGTIRGVHMSYETWSPTWFKVAHRKPKLHKNRREIYGSFSIPRRIQRSKSPTISWNSDKLVKNFNRQIISIEVKENVEKGAKEVECPCAFCAMPCKCPKTSGNSSLKGATGFEREELRWSLAKKGKTGNAYKFRRSRIYQKAHNRDSKHK